jgi:hypothetical protein
MKNYRYQLRLVKSDGTHQTVSTAYKDCKNLITKKAFFSQLWNISEENFYIIDTKERKYITA